MYALDRHELVYTGRKNIPDIRDRTCQDTKVSLQPKKLSDMSILVLMVNDRQAAAPRNRALGGLLTPEGPSQVFPAAPATNRRQFSVTISKSPCQHHDDYKFCFFC